MTGGRPDPMNVRLASDVTELEARLLITALYEQYGIDFSQHSQQALRRRLIGFAEAHGLASLSLLQDKLLHQPEWLNRLLGVITTNSVPMFRTPSFFQCLRERIVPALKTDPYFRIWLAGCASGEEAYMLAVVLQDEGVYDRCRIYATDVSEEHLLIAKKGEFNASAIAEYGSIMAESGGLRRLSEYYTIVDDQAVFRSELRKNIVFARHNLATDSSFNDFSLILCRSSLIQLHKPLRDRIFTLLQESLTFYGLLAVGNKESLRLSPYQKHYQEFDPEHRIYRKVGLSKEKEGKT